MKLYVYVLRRLLLAIPVLLGVSLITNMAAGVLKKKLHHTEVMETAQRVQKDFTALVLGILEKLSDA